mgnify:CR=1 FL=1
MSVRIITDTSSEYTPKEAKEQGITLIPMSLTYGEETLLDGEEIEKSEFYRRLLENKEIPVTSQPSPEQFLREFKKAKEAGESVVAVLLSSSLSGTFQSAMLAKQMADYEEIYLIDSLNATAAVKILVGTARKLIQEGKTAAQIAQQLEALKGRIQICAVVDTLEYLYKGGRLSRAEAGLGTLANIKPLVQISREGKVEVFGKCIGRKRACHQLVEKIKEEKMDPAYPIYLLYSANQENCRQFQKELMERTSLNRFDEMLEIGATIGTHIGGGAFGIAFVRAD